MDDEFYSTLLDASAFRDPRIAFRKKNEILNFGSVDPIARYNEAGQFLR